MCEIYYQWQNQIENQNTNPHFQLLDGMELNRFVSKVSRSVQAWQLKDQTEQLSVCFGLTEIQPVKSRFFNTADVSLNIRLNIKNRSNW